MKILSECSQYMPVYCVPYRCMLAHTIDVSRLNYPKRSYSNVKLAPEYVTEEY